MRLGISSYTYVWSAGVPGYEQPSRPLIAWDLLDKACQLGVRVVQIADNLPLSQLSDEERRRFAQHAKESGLLVEIGMSGIDQRALVEGLALAVEFQSPILRLLLDTPSHQPDVDEVVTSLGRVTADFQRENIVIAIENHDRFPAATLRRMIERIDSRSVGICFDTANSIGCLESAEHVFDTLQPYIVNVHLKDYSIFRPPHHKGFVVEGRPAGQGDLDFDQFVPRLLRQVPDANMILELWPPPQRTLAESIALENRWAEESIEFLRRIVPD